ncbi:hypothetical protein H632_c2328p0 [Helicosporidium sp. ATCC 50920]|nr:hypothetical protein H632_c2328p0 [Helicosporidium sp. ATCC 50920]|eukprot:KDD73300.1 hypothetical protein H632_c2328p0 [Helicosporidium sp. ATCC 50920]
MRLGLVACVLLAVVGMAAAGDITPAFTDVVINVPNPITIVDGATANIDNDDLAAVSASGTLTIDQGAKVTLTSLTATENPFTITTAGTASVTGGLVGPKVVLDVSGGTVDLTGDIVDLDLTIKPKVRKNQAGAPADSTVKVDKVTGTATVTNPETATDIRPPGPSPGVSPDVAPLGCKHYRFWVQHTHGVDCEKEKNTKSEYIKWLCHNLYCN